MSILHTTPAEVKPAIATVIMGVVPVAEIDLDTTDYSTPFVPTEADEAARLADIAEREADDERLRDEVMTDYWMNEREAEMSAHFDRFDLMNPNEIIECRGFHPAVNYAD